MSHLDADFLMQDLAECQGEETLLGLSGPLTLLVESSDAL